MRLLFGHDRDVAHFVAEHIPHIAHRIPQVGHGEVFGVGAAIGVLNDRDELVAGTVFHNWDEHYRTIEVSCAATTPMWAKPEIVRTILRYPFGQLGCTRVTAVTPRRTSPGATSARRFLESLGFRREGSVRRAFGEDSAIIYGLLAEEWAAHRLNRASAVDGQVCTQGAAAA